MQSRGRTEALYRCPGGRKLGACGVGSSSTQRFGGRNGDVFGQLSMAMVVKVEELVVLLLYGHLASYQDVT
jgi:cobalamin synthase